MAIWKLKSCPRCGGDIFLEGEDKWYDKKLSGVRHQDLAERVAALRETVTGALAEFRAAGMVELGWRKIVILNEEELRRIAAG